MVAAAMVGGWAAAMVAAATGVAWEAVREAVAAEGDRREDMVAEVQLARTCSSKLGVSSPVDTSNSQRQLPLKPHSSNDIWICASAR